MYMQRQEQESLVTYMCKSNNKWIQAAWQRETVKENNTIIDEALRTMTEIDNTLQNLQRRR